MKRSDKSAGPPHRFTLTISLEGGELQEALHIPPYLAPQEGYQKTWKHEDPPLGTRKAPGSDFNLFYKKEGVFGWLNLGFHPDTEGKEAFISVERQTIEAGGRDVDCD